MTSLEFEQLQSEHIYIQRLPTKTKPILFLCVDDRPGDAEGGQEQAAADHHQVGGGRLRGSDQRDQKAPQRPEQGDRSRAEAGGNAGDTA